jgi:hypothetical protein
MAEAEVSGEALREEIERTGVEEERRQEEEQDNIGLTSNGVARDLTHYVSQGREDSDSSGDEHSEREKEDGEEDGFDEGNQLPYELVDDDYEQQPETEPQPEQSEEEEFGEFKEADVVLNGSGNHQEAELEGEGKNEDQSPTGRVPSFPVNRSSIPPLTTGQRTKQRSDYLSFLDVSICALSLLTQRKSIPSNEQCNL